MSEPQLRQQTRTWLTAISADLRRTVKQEAERLRSSVDERIAVLERVVSASDKQLEELAVNVAALAEEMATEAVAQARQQMEATAQAELTKVRDRLQADREAMQTEFEAARIALEVQLAETESDIWAIRQKRDELASSLKQTRERMAEVEQANGQATLRRELAEARLEEEVQRRVAIEKQLETSRQELVLARAEAESRRLEAQVATERVHELRKAASPVFNKRNDAAPKTGTERPTSAPVAPVASIAPVAPVAASGESTMRPGEVLEFSVNRKARRVKVHAASEVLVDGVASVLVDISTLGAQVLSPTTLRPSRVVRLTLRTDRGTCAAEGRIVWAQLESSTADAGAHYRAGVQFTNTDLAAINALLAQEGLPQVATAS